MMTDELHARFDLPLTLDTPEGRVLGGSRRADGRGVAIHQLDRLSSASRARLLAQVESAITAGRDDLSLEQVDGATMVITPMLTPGTTLSAWLEELTSQSTPAADQGPPVAGEFTRMFSARPVTGAPEPPAEEQAAAVQGEFTRQFAARPIDVPPVAPPAAAMSQAPPATLPPADPPASSTPKVGSFTALFGAPSSPSSDDPLFTKGSEGVGTSGSPSAPDAAPPTIRISLKLPTPPVNAPPLSPHPADTPQERSPVSMPGDQLTAGSIGPDLAIAVPSGEISPDAATVILQAFELPQPGSLTSPETALTSTPPASAVTPTPSVGQAGGSADAAIFEVEPSVPPVAPPTIAHAPPVSPAAPPTIRHEPPALAAPPTIRHEPPAPPAAPPIIAHAPSTPPAAPPTIADVPPAPPAAPAGGGFTEIFGAPTPAPAPPAGNPVNPSAPAAGAGQSAPAGPGEFTQLFLAQSGTPSPTPPPPPYPAGGGDGGSLGGLPPLGRDGHGGSGRADSPPPLKVKLFPDAAPQSGGESTAPPSGSATGMMRAAPGSSPGMESSPSLIVRLPSRPTEPPPQWEAGECQGPSRRQSRLPARTSVHPTSPRLGRRRCLGCRRYPEAMPRRPRCLAIRSRLERPVCLEWAAYQPCQARPDEVQDQCPAPLARGRSLVR